MSGSKDSIARTIRVTLVLCVIASLFVSITAVSLKNRQEINKLNEKKTNVLQAGGLIKLGEKVSVDEVNRLFEQIKISVIDLKKGEKIDVDVDKFDQLKSAKSDGEVLKGSEDIAGIKRLENKGLVYEVVKQGAVTTVIIPIRGYGLWSTLYGFLALDRDGNTIKGITFYQHGETPGLGGEVDNPKWKASWVGKKVYNNSGEVGIRVVKGGANPSSDSEIDGLSGATLTANGVENLIQFWLGERGYAKYLKNL